MATQDISVLIADDNELNRWLLCEQLSQWTSDITSAKDGREAWQLLQTRKYSLIFLDVNMPFLNGFDLIGKLKTEETVNRLTPTIAITAHKQLQQQQSLETAGFNDYLIKPILLEHLKRIMAQWLASVDSSVNYYAAQIAKRTEYNRELCQILLNKMFVEIPEQLHGITQAHQQSDYQQAWQITHKLHGTFCFYGFADFLPDVELLEQSLLNQNATASNTQLSAIKKRFTALLDNKSVILAAVDSDAILDQ